MASFADILIALKTKIAEVVTDTNAIIPVARRQLPNLVGNRDILLRVRSFTIKDSTVNAAGRHAMWITRPVDIVIRQRNYLDVSLQDYQFLVHETLGILSTEEDLIDNLELWHPTDGDGNFLLVEPARIVSGDDPVREGVSADPHWGSVTIRLEITYEQTLDQDVQ